MRRPCGLFMGIVLMGLSGCAWMTRSSVTSGPTVVEGNGPSTRPSLSQGGRYVAFESAATNLVAGDTNGVVDVFVRDNVAGVTERVSVASDGTQGDGPSRAPAISDDGRFVAFETDATNLVAGDADDDADVVVHDRQLATTTLVSTDVAVPAPLGTDDFEGTGAAISGDGSVVAFRIGVPFQGACCVPLGPYVRDLNQQTTTVMPNVAGFLSGSASLSDDGARIAYGQFGPNDQIGNAPYAVVVADTAAAAVVATVSSGTLIHRTLTHFDVVLSGDGNTVGFLLVDDSVGTLHRFEVDQPGLVPVVEGLTNPGLIQMSDDGTVFGLRVHTDYAVTDAAGSPPRIVSADPAGNPASTPEGIVGDLSGDGRFVAFASSDPDLLTGDTNHVSDVFVRSASGSTAGPS